jgi:hypothetical protein
MCNKSRNWFVLLAAGLAASLSAGTIAAAAPISVGMKVPLVQSQVLPAGYRGYDPYGNNGFLYWPAFDTPPSRTFLPPPRDPYYEPAYYYDRTYYDRSDYDRSDYRRSHYHRTYHDRSDYREWSPPRRPRSCGKYHYRSGGCCLDARWHPPYVGPKW